jgi:hypothetical protein
MNEELTLVAVLAAKAASQDNETQERSHQVDNADPDPKSSNRSTTS